MLKKWISVAIICGLISLTMASSASGNYNSVGRASTIDLISQHVTHTLEHGFSTDTIQCLLFIAWTGTPDNNQIDHVIYYHIGPGSSEPEILGVVTSPPFQITIDICRLGLGFHQIYGVAYDVNGKEITSASFSFFQPDLAYIPLLLKSK